MKLTSFLLLLTSCAALAVTEEQINKTFNASPGGTVIVDVEFGSIDVNTNAGGGVAVDVWRKIGRKSKTDEEKFLRDHPVTFAQEGNTVTVRCRYKEKNSSSWFNWGSGNRNEAKYTVRVPTEFKAQLNTAGGSISVSDLTGKVKANTSGGSLRFTHIHGPLDGNTSGGSIRVADCEGNIQVETSGGGIEVNGGSGSLKGGTSGGSVAVKTFNGPAAVQTSGGGITIENVNGKVQGSTSGGSINATLLSPLPGNVSLSTSGGSVTAKVPETAAFNLDAETSGGGVSCELPVTIVGKKERNELKGPVNGGGPTVSLHTSGGSIRVKKF